MAELVDSRPSRYASLRRPLLGGLLSALVTGAIQAVQIWIFPLFGYALPSMRLQVLFMAASMPGLLGGREMSLPLMLAISVSFWFGVGALIARLVQRNWLAVVLWLLGFALVDLLCYLFFFTTINT